MLLRTPPRSSWWHHNSSSLFFLFFKHPLCTHGKLLHPGELQWTAWPTRQTAWRLTDCWHAWRREHVGFCQTCTCVSNGVILDSGWATAEAHVCTGLCLDVDILRLTHKTIIQDKQVVIGERWQSLTLSEHKCVCTYEGSGYCVAAECLTKEDVSQQERKVKPQQKRLCTQEKLF